MKKKQQKNVGKFPRKARKILLTGVPKISNSQTTAVKFGTENISTP